MGTLNKKVFASVQSQVRFKSPTFFLGMELSWDFWHLLLPPRNKYPEKSFIASSPRCPPRRWPSRFLGSHIASSCCRKQLEVVACTGRVLYCHAKSWRWQGNRKEKIIATSGHEKSWGINTYFCNIIFCLFFAEVWRCDWLMYLIFSLK